MRLPPDYNSNSKYIYSKFIIVYSDHYYGARQEQNYNSSEIHHYNHMIMQINRFVQRLGMKS